MSSRKSGFTIIELMIAVIFLATLVLTIALLILHLTSIFQKGMNLKAINSAGRNIIDDFTRSVNASLNIKDEEIASIRQYYIQDTGSVTINRNLSGLAGIDLTNAPLRGVFCTKQYTYVWNTAYVLNDIDYDVATPAYFLDVVDLGGGNTQATFRDTTLGEAGNFQLVRVQDANRHICTAYRVNSTDARDNAFIDDPTDPTDQLMQVEGLIEVVELLPLAETDIENNDRTNRTSAGNLALYDFRVFPIVRSKQTSHAFYSATFIIGTMRGSVNIMTQHSECTDNSVHLVTDFNYCAVNKFNFSTRATGETKKGGNS